MIARGDILGAVTVPGSSASCSRVTRAAAFAIADRVTLLAERDTVRMKARVQHTPPARHHMIRTRVADHHPVGTGRPRLLEERLGAAERAGVLVDVQQQHHAARPAADV